jgi:hypothetical protein
MTGPHGFVITDTIWLDLYCATGQYNVIVSKGNDESRLICSHSTHETEEAAFEALGVLLEQSYKSTT